MLCKGLADTALKQPMRLSYSSLVDVAQDVVITESDCGTLRGLTTTALKNNEETVESLTTDTWTYLHDIYIR